MKVRVTVEIDAETVRVLQRAGRLSAGPARAAFIEEIEAVIAAHLEDLESEAEVSGDERR